MRAGEDFGSARGWRNGATANAKDALGSLANRRKLHRPTLSAPAHSRFMLRLLFFCEGGGRCGGKRAGPWFVNIDHSARLAPATHTACFRPNAGTLERRKTLTYGRGVHSCQTLTIGCVALYFTVNLASDVGQVFQVCFPRKSCVLSRKTRHNHMRNGGPAPGPFPGVRASHARAQVGQVAAGCPGEGCDVPQAAVPVIHDTPQRARPLAS